MPVAPIPPYLFPGLPVSNITPFTYRDGATFLQILESLRRYITHVIVPSVDENFNTLVAEFLASVEKMEQDNRASIEQMEADNAASVAKMEASNAAAIAAMEADNAASYVALLQMYTDFRDDFTAIVNTINNKSGAVDVQHVVLTSDYVVNMDPTWPTNVPVIFRFVQDGVGGRILIPGTRVTSVPAQINATPDSVTYVTFFPNESGQFDGFAWDAVSDTFDVMAYGAKGDGVTDDTYAIRVALTAANLVGGTLYFPTGRYWLATGSHLEFPTLGNGDFLRYMFRVESGVTVRGNGATIVESIDNATRRIGFFIAGSDVTFDGMRFENVWDLANGSRPTNIPIASGDGYDTTLTGVLKNIHIRNCQFDRAWHPVKFQVNGTNGTMSIESVTVTSCISRGEWLGESNGGFNFMSSPEGRIRDVTVANCQSHDNTMSAAIGYYGVHHGAVTGNVCRRSGINAAGFQCENGAHDITVTGNTFYEHFSHVWVDDSTNITVGSNSMSNTEVRDLNKGVRITIQGYPTNPNKVVESINVFGNTLKNCYITKETFGTAAGSISTNDISIVGNIITLADNLIPYGILMGQTRVCQISNNTVYGAKTASIFVGGSAGKIVMVTGNVTGNIVAESTCVGFNMNNQSLVQPPVVSDNRFMNGFTQAATSTPGQTFPVRGMIGMQSVLTGAGEPTTSAEQGSLYLRQDGMSGTTLYIKAGAGLLGWVAV